MRNDFPVYMAARCQRGTWNPRCLSYNFFFFILNVFTQNFRKCYEIHIFGEEKLEEETLKSEEEKNLICSFRTFWYFFPSHLSLYLVPTNIHCYGIIYLIFKVFIYLNNLYTQCGAQTYDPQFKSHMLSD